MCRPALFAGMIKKKQQQQPNSLEVGGAVTWIDRCLDAGRWCLQGLTRVIGLTELDLSATCVDVCASVLVIEILVLN